MTGCQTEKLLPSPSLSVFLKLQPLHRHPDCYAENFLTDSQTIKIPTVWFMGTYVKVVMAAEVCVCVCSPFENCFDEPS